MPTTTDETRVRALLERDRGWALYALGDLTPGHREHCTWFVEPGSSPGEAIVLLYRALSLPIILAFGPAERVRPLLDEAMAAPHHFVVLRKDVLDALAATHRLELCIATWRYVLEPERFGAHPVDGVERLSVNDLPALRELYRHWGETELTESFFDPMMVEGGVFFGVRRGEALVAAAGTHVVADALGVAAVGGIYTRPDHRGRGLAGRTTSAVVAALLERGLSTIGLNVARSNEPAIHIYERLGFRRHCPYFEAHAHRRVAGYRR